MDTEELTQVYNKHGLAHTSVGEHITNYSYFFIVQINWFVSCKTFKICTHINKYLQICTNSTDQFIDLIKYFYDSKY